MLGITFFLSMFADTMPPTSEHMPILGIYYAFTLGIVSTTILFAIITIKITKNPKLGKINFDTAKYFVYKYLLTT
jgi:hypothetical protein